MKLFSWGQNMEFLKTVRWFFIAVGKMGMTTSTSMSWQSDNEEKKGEDDYFLLGSSVKNKLEKLWNQECKKKKKMTA